MYEIREDKNKLPFKLFFRKEKGFKFKKAFVSQQAAEWFIDDYLRQCCLNCKQQGWVYKTQLPKPLRSRLKSGHRPVPPVGTLAICPECKAKHQVQYEDVLYESFGHGYTAARLILVQIPD